MRGLNETWTRRLTVVAIAAVSFAFAYLVQPAWDNERAHYDLTRALSQGTPMIDESFSHPPLRTIDSIRIRGHIYATKAPGLAAVSLPPYLLLRSAGAATTGEPTRIVWAIHLWSIVLPGIALLLLVRRRAEQVEPGFGLIAATSLGVATLVLPFATVSFAHVLSATLGFTAFVLLLRQREDLRSPVVALVAGLVAGCAFTVEYTLGVIALVLATLVLTGSQRRRRMVLYCLGVAAGAIPALAYSAWAFGNPFHLPQEGWHHQGAKPLPGFIGLTQPSLNIALRILFYPGGIAPILLPAIVGAVVLWRRGARPAAAVPMAVAGLFFVFSSSSVEAFGGASPGPRFMIPALPFLAIPLATAYRTIPGATLGLAVGGGTFMIAATLTTALEGWDGLVFHRLRHGRFVESAANVAGLSGRGWAALFVIALAVAAVAALVVTPWRVRAKRDTLAALVALCGWFVLATQSHPLLKGGPGGEAALVLIAACSAALVALAYRARFALRTASSVQSTGAER